MEYTIIFDLETTGFKGMPQMSNNHKVIQASFYCLENEERFDTFVDPGMKIPPWSTKCHGINDYNLVDAPSFKKMFAMFIENVNIKKGCRVTMIAHNCYGFDRNVLMKEIVNNSIDISEYNIKFWDTLPYLRRHYPELASKDKAAQVYNLGNLYKYFFHKPLHNAHRADADVRALTMIFQTKIQPNLCTFEEMFDTQLVDHIERECFGSIKFIGAYRAKLLSQFTNCYNTSDLRNYLIQKRVFSGNKYFVDDFMKSKIGLKDFHQRMHVIATVLDVDIWERSIIDNMRLIDTDCMSEIDYYIKYKYRLEDKPPDNCIFMRGLYEIKNN